MYFFAGPSHRRDPVARLVLDCMVALLPDGLVRSCRDTTNELPRPGLVLGRPAISHVLFMTIAVENGHVLRAYAPPRAPRLPSRGTAVRGFVVMWPCRLADSLLFLTYPQTFTTQASITIDHV